MRPEVTDSGPGLEPAERERIFERFYRPDPARPRESGGAGLGLPIARSFAEALRGRLGVDSEPGRGATFWLVLPRS